MILALIGVLLAGAMVFISCDGASCKGDGKCYMDVMDTASMADQIESWCFGDDATQAGDCFSGQSGTKFDCKC